MSEFKSSGPRLAKSLNLSSLLMRQGLHQRHVASTQMNELSSRQEKEPGVVGFLYASLQVTFGVHPESGSFQYHSWWCYLHENSKARCYDGCRLLPLKFAATSERF